MVVMIMIVKLGVVMMMVRGVDFDEDEDNGDDDHYNDDDDDYNEG